MNNAKLIRKLHRWGGIVTVLPLLVILLSGLILQFKKEMDWVQPPTNSGVGGAPVISFAAILHAASSVPQAGISGWDDVDRLDVRPGKGMAKVRSRKGFEVQVDTLTGAVLHAAARRSDIIEDFHDGGYFSDAVKLWIFVPTGVILVGLLATGVYIFFLPSLSRRRRGAALSPASDKGR